MESLLGGPPSSANGSEQHRSKSGRHIPGHNPGWVKNDEPKLSAQFPLEEPKLARVPLAGADRCFKLAPISGANIRPKLTLPAPAPSGKKTDLPGDLGGTTVWVVQPPQLQSERIISRAFLVIHMLPRKERKHPKQLRFSQIRLCWAESWWLSSPVPAQFVRSAQLSRRDGPLLRTALPRTRHLLSVSFAPTTYRIIKFWLGEDLQRCG